MISASASEYVMSRSSGGWGRSSAGLESGAGDAAVATVTATSPLKLLVLDRHDFNEMLEFAMPQIAPKLLAVVGARMRAIDEHNGVDSTLGL